MLVMIYMTLPFLLVTAYSHILYCHAFCSALSPMPSLLCLPLPSHTDILLTLQYTFLTLTGLTLFSDCPWLSQNKIASFCILHSVAP